MWKKILVAADPSQASTKALEQALDLAAKGSAQLVVICVAELFLGAHEELVSGLQDKFLAEARTAGEAAKARAGQAGVAVALRVESGETPSTNIIDAAKGEGCDLIVLGHRSKTGIDRYLIGSVAARVVEHAPCSVLVVR